jgi:hypothetical protein
VQARLADLGQHRASAIPDLLVAAAAELTDAAVLHLDKDPELIAESTGQPTGEPLTGIFAIDGKSLPMVYLPGVE